MYGCCCCSTLEPCWVQIWHPPFHKLTNTEVQYLVRGIAEVYGQDEGEWRQQQQQLMQASSAAGPGMQVG